MSDKITRDDLNEVSGGSAGTKNLGGKCRHYKCNSCGCGVHRYQDDSFGVCRLCAVMHDISCPHRPHEEGSCDTCAHDLGGRSCAVPND